jgi:hypothetical protein
LSKVFSWFYKSYFKQNRKPIIHFPVYHYKDLFGQSVKDLSPKQGSKVKHLLQTCSHIFAKDDADFGRTSIIKHEIEV